MSPRWFLRPRWIVAIVLIPILAAVFVRLGFWQLDRLEQRRALNARVERGISAAPVPLDVALGSADPAFRRVTAEGSYAVDGQLILFGRTLEGNPGNHVLTPLELANDTSVLVDRGWVPIELDRPGDAEVAPPTGTAHVTGILMPSEDGEPPDPSGTVGAIDTRAIATADRGLGLIDAFFLRLQEQAPPPSTGLPRPVPLPAPNEGPHLSYAVQWFLFAGVAVVGLAILLRKTAREERRRRRAGGSAPGDRSGER